MRQPAVPEFFAVVRVLSRRRGDDSGDGLGTERFLTESVRDYVTGEPIAGATVDLDDVSIVTGADGGFSLSLGTANDTRTRSFSFDNFRIEEYR
jgi:hypothetical protein